MTAEVGVTDQIVQLVARGYSLRAVGRQVGLSATTVYRRLRLAGDTVPRRRRRPLSVQDRRRIVSLAAEGETSLRRIAAEVQRSWHTVRRVVDAHDLPRNVPVLRCASCGYRITVFPCQICRARAS
jgi:transposase-like protein